MSVMLEDAAPVLQTSVSDKSGIFLQNVQKC